MLPSLGWVAQQLLFTAFKQVPGGTCQRCFLKPSPLDVQASAADFARLKRYKKALKLLSSSKARHAVMMLKSRSRLVLLLLMLAHIIIFVVLKTLLSSHKGTVSGVSCSVLRLALCKCLPTCTAAKEQGA